MPQRLLIVGAGPNQVRILQKAAEMGLWVCALDGDPGAHGFAHASAHEVDDIRDPDAVHSAACAHQVDGIYPAAELSVEAVAIACERLNLPGIPPDVAARVRDKSLMRDRLTESRYPNPAYQRVETPEDAVSASESIGFPVVVKPVDGNSSKGVRRVDAVSEVAAATEFALSVSQRGAAIVEACLDGDEYCVDGLMFNGEYYPGGITGKEVSSAPFCYDEAIFMPGSPDGDLCDEIQACAEDALAAIGFTTGTTHVEIMVTARGPQVIEIAGRPGGGRIPTDLIPIAYGTDFVADSIRVALGERPRGTRTRARGAALRWIPAQAGTVARVEGEDSIAKMPGVLEVVLSVRAGDSLDSIVDCVTRDRVGYVLTEGDTGAQALERARDACAHCKVTVT